MNITIINSQDFWSMGWATSPEGQQDVVESLTRAGIQTQVYEVSSKQELDELLTSPSIRDSLVWPNAYQVYAFPDSNETVWLADIIHEHGLPMIGSSAQALKNVMFKGHCQTLLHKQNVPIPTFAAIEEKDLEQLSERLKEQQMEFPLFVKPNALSTSKGITQDCITHDLNSLIQQIQILGSNYGYPVMVEEFLPGRDITAAIFLTSEEPLILATYYDTQIHEEPGAVLDYDTRLRDWDDGKWLSVVEDVEILAQLQSIALPTCRAVGINEFTRIDCRLDRNGQVKVFDVNGLPGLENPFSTTVWQMIVKMQGQADLHAFDTLISLIIYCSAQRQHIDIPSRIKLLAEDYINNERLDCSVSA